MDANSQRQKNQDRTLPLLNAAIEAVNLAKEVSSVTPAKAVFGTVSILLTMIKDSMANKTDYVELGLACADVCGALHRGMNGKKLDDLSQSVCEAIARLTTTVTEIQRKVVKKCGRSRLSRLVYAKDDKDTIAAWKLELNRVLQVFTAELVLNTQIAVSDMRHDMSKIREAVGGQVRSIQTSIILGELPPPPPRVCLGRDELIEEVIGLVENLTPIALIGPGGIGKTSIALTVLHHDRIKQRFGGDRRFMRCDQFPASRAHFLSQLSKVIGAGVDNPEDITPLRPFLSSREIILFLDNAESILDPHVTGAREVYAVVEELSQFKTICLCITSRVSTVPRHCKRPIIPTLSMESACGIFYGIYDDGGRSDVISDLLRRLDFHALSITLLATTASHNMWDYNRLAREWDTHRVQILRTDYDESLAATIELSLTSPTFCKLGPDARDLLGVIAFFPQGINEDNIDWLFPTIPDRRNLFDKFCILSLTHRGNGFITMLAPLRDYLRPQNPASCPLLRMTKEYYFSRLSVNIDPGEPGFEKARWIISEDANVEHLLDVFTTIDPNSTNVWNVCHHFMEHLFWHRKRLVVLGPKVEGLPDGHPSKPQCLFQLSRLVSSVGNYTECKRLLVHALGLWRERGDYYWIAHALKFLSHVCRRLGLRKEGIGHAEEALEIFKRLNAKSDQAQSSRQLARLLYDDNQLDAAEEAISRAIDLASGEGDQFTVCQCHRILGDMCSTKGEPEKAIIHYDTALGIASSFDWIYEQFWIHYSFANLFFSEDGSDDAHAHVERAKSYAADDACNLGRAMELQARFWCEEGKFEEAESEALDAAEMFEKLGATKDLEKCMVILRTIGEKKDKPVAAGESDPDVHGAE